MAAEALSSRGIAVDLYDAMPSVGRKFLLAGKGGLNLTHSEEYPAFVSRFGSASERVAEWLQVLSPEAIRAWASELGVETFVGTSGRVFPKEMKAAPLLRAWLRRLRENRVTIHARHRWLGWQDQSLLFDTPDGPMKRDADAVILALGGASWKKLGSDGAWVPVLEGRGLAVSPLVPANCGFDADWTPHFRERCAGQPMKSVVARFGDVSRQGEFVITETGVEGSLIYSFGAALRDTIAREGSATLQLDLVPGLDRERLTRELSKPRGSKSMAHHLRSRAGIEGTKAGILREVLTAEQIADVVVLVDALKSFPLRLLAPRPIDEAISTAGGVSFAELDEHLMLRKHPGVFCAGEMLDWEAPTGGYLLSACLAGGLVAGRGAAEWLKDNIFSS